MHSQRRLCLFSAVNIDGQQSRRTQRGPWRLDPRIPHDRQIMKGCYGNAPRFSRGHMTRREDPAWGDPSLARLGNLDSMHVTNTAPQMQVFNAGIWLGLEDYALNHARQDDMRLCVLTGPVLRPDDPVRFGVQIPLQFWKVIAFIHDGRRELSATGYSMSQRDFLKEEEFVFGVHQTHQRSLAWIEQEAGISFGALRDADRFNDAELATPQPLSAPGQIRW
jgi:endonuclease G